MLKRRRGEFHQRLLGGGRAEWFLRNALCGVLSVEDYHASLISLLTVPGQSRVVETDDEVAGLARFVGSADLLVTGTESHGLSGDLFGRPSDQLVDSVDCTAVMVQPHSERRDGLIKRAVLDRLF